MSTVFSDLGKASGGVRSAGAARALFARLAWAAVFALAAGAGALWAAKAGGAGPWALVFMSVAAFAAMVAAAGAGISAWRLTRQRDAALAFAHEARGAADNAADFFIAHDADGRVRALSPAGEALMGWESRRIAGSSLQELAHTEDRLRLRAALTQSVCRGLPAEADIRLRRADGAWMWVELRCLPGEAGVIVAARDIDWRKRREAELVEARDAALAASERKSRFLANMSHELRTPLNAVIGFSDMMRGEVFGELGHQKYNEYADLISESGRHLLDLINDVLDISKIEASRYDLHRERVSLREEAQNAIRITQPAADQAGVKVRLRIDEDLTPLFADRRAMKQIFLNLLSNAVKFTPPGGAVVAAAAEDGGDVLIAVSDTGAGIAAGDLEKLGRPFEQAANARPGELGAGLGLSLVRKFAQLHGGDVHISSREGVGTTVIVRLPRTEEGEAAVSAVAHMDDASFSSAPVPMSVQPAAPVADLPVHGQIERVRAFRAELDDRLERGAA